MFSTLLARLREELRATKNLVAIHDHTRTLFYKDEPPDRWAAVRQSDPGKTNWQVYDHCAALTRLYAVYSTFVEEAVGEYLKLLPELYSPYEQLPEAILRQHRTGFGQILLKIGEGGPYGHLKDVDIISQLSNSLAGRSPYVLLQDAFFVDRQNYRADVLGKLLGSLAIDNGQSRIANHVEMQKFLAERIGGTTSFESELNGFIKLRNEAAHGHVEEVIGIARLQNLADFLVVLSEILMELLARAFLSRKVELGQFSEIGKIKEAHYSRKIVVAEMNEVNLGVGDEVLLLHKGGHRFTKVVSLQLEGATIEKLQARPGLHLGIGLTVPSRVGGLIVRVALPPEPVTQAAFDPATFGPNPHAPAEEEALNIDAESMTPMNAEEEITPEVRPKAPEV